MFIRVSELFFSWNFRIIFFAKFSHYFYCKLFALIFKKFSHSFFREMFAFSAKFSHFLFRENFEFFRETDWREISRKKRKVSHFSWANEMQKWSEMVAKNAKFSRNDFSFSLETLGKTKDHESRLWIRIYWLRLWLFYI